MQLGPRMGRLLVTVDDDGYRDHLEHFILGARRSLSAAF
jgi:hypothetical protein